MNALTPSPLAMVPFVSVHHMMQIVNHVGPERFMADLAACIEEDFRRWELFDKTPRVAAHSQEGVIELMPTSDGEVYGFKYVNGHPKNMAAGFQTVAAVAAPATNRTTTKHATLTFLIDRSFPKENVNGLHCHFTFNMPA